MNLLFYLGMKDTTDHVVKSGTEDETADSAIPMYMLFNNNSSKSKKNPYRNFYKKVEGQATTVQPEKTTNRRRIWKPSRWR